jgi:plastocyanin
MSTKISQTRYMILGSALILAVLIAGCTTAPSGAPQTPAVTMTTTPAPISTTVPQTTQATTPAPTSTTVPQTTQATAPMETVSQTPASLPVTEITIRNSSFNPKTVTIPVGTMVNWTNLESTPHMISNSVTPMFGPGSIFLSPDLNRYDSFNFTFTTAGVYQYFLVDRPDILGTITVE